MWEDAVKNNVKGLGGGPNGWILAIAAELVVWYPYRIQAEQCNKT